jgi:pimeloyl-ACP methyl ester carboxylesterase
MKTRVAILLALTAFVFCVAPLGSADWKLMGDGSLKPGYEKYFFFDGFDFQNYRPSINHHMLADKIHEERDAILQNTEKTEKYVFVGHSQGGLRALATASLMRAENREEYERLQGIITVSGIDQGLEALAGGIGVFSQKALGRINILWNGTRSVVGVFAFPGTLTNGLLLAVPGDLSAMIRLASLIAWPFEADYLYFLHLIAGNSSALGGITEMVPGSQFIADYVVGDVPKYEIRAKLLGYREVAHPVYLIDIWGIQWLQVGVWYSHEPMYDLVAVKVREAEGLKVLEEMPVGYIVGTDSNTLGMNKDTEGTARQTANVLGYVFEAAQIAHKVKMVILIGYFCGSPMYYYDAMNAKNLCWNLDAHLNVLKGSPENDGLVAVSSQFYPKSVHANTLGHGVEEGVQLLLNHEAIRTDGEVQDIVQDMLKEAKDKRGVTNYDG